MIKILRAVLAALSAVVIAASVGCAAGGNTSVSSGSTASSGLSSAFDSSSGEELSQSQNQSSVLAPSSGGQSSAFSEHVHVFDKKIIDERTLKSAATYYESGEYYYSCECGEIGGESFETELLSPDYTLIDKYVDSFISGGLKNGKPYPIWNTEKDPSSPTWNYIDGCMMISFLRLYELTGDEKYYSFVKTFIDYFVEYDGKNNGAIRSYSASDKNLDNVNEGRVLFELYSYSGDEKYRRAMDTIFKQYSLQGRNSLGSFEHKSSYPHQVWLDGLYMAEIFYTRYLTLTGGNYDDVMLQFKNVEENMKDAETGLYYHGFDVGEVDKSGKLSRASWADPETGLSKSFWLRAMGWYIAALSDMTEYLPKDSTEWQTIRGYLIGAVDAVLKYEHSEKHIFYQVVDQAAREKDGNYLETSGSALIAYAILHGVNTGALPYDEYWNAGKRIFNGIYNNNLIVGGSGMPILTFICRTAGLGGRSSTAPMHPSRDGTFEYYVSEKLSDNEAKGVAPFIMAYVEILSREG